MNSPDKVIDMSDKAFKSYECVIVPVIEMNMVNIWITDKVRNKFQKFHLESEQEGDWVSLNGGKWGLMGTELDKNCKITGTGLNTEMIDAIELILYRTAVVISKEGRKQNIGIVLPTQEGMSLIRFGSYTK